ncbi:MAG: UpxY family transcription antiterminator [Balneolia bacterium]|nr:UpxY family transcription antiterminator [Balneolia bacterium]
MSKKTSAPLPKETVLRQLRNKNEEPRWYALKTGPRKEKKLNERLQEAGIESYLPLKKELRQWSDRKKWVEEPMFNGYIFVRTVSTEFVNALQHDGAIHFVRFSGRYSAIPEDQIEFIRKVAENQLRYEITEQSFEKGDTVEIIQGPLKGLTGVWLKHKTKYNVSVQIDQLASVLSVEIPAAFLKKVESKDSGEK